MTRNSLCWVVCALVLVHVVGCSKPEVPPHTHHPEFEVTLCGLCGEIKGGEKCCKPGIAICPNCGLHKGSVLCCSPAISGRRDVVLCTKCGEKAFTKKCCQEGIATCPKCGLHKGSPGCCKIQRVAGDGSGESYEHAHRGGHAT